MTVTCGWPGCQWGAQRQWERDAWDALYVHLRRAHGHDVTAEYVAPERDSSTPDGKMTTAPGVLEHRRTPSPSDDLTNGRTSVR